jgi:hypothetical protein
MIEDIVWQSIIFEQKNLPAPRDSPAAASRADSKTKSARQKDYDDNDQDKPEAAARQEAPLAAMTPHGQRSYQGKDRENYQDQSNNGHCAHIAFRVASMLAAATCRLRYR